MIFLTSTSDKLQVITGSASQIDIHASWIDLVTGVVSAGRTNTKINTAATTDVVASPAASTTRNVKTLKVGNNHATASCLVTIQHTDGTNVIIFEQVTLLPLERIGYEEGVGFRYFDSLGREKVNSAAMSPNGNSNTADVVASAADTYLTGASLAIPPTRIQANTGFRWRFRMSKTGAGVAAATFNIRTGTAGAVGDASRCLYTFGAQSAVADDGFVELEANFRAVGASAVLNSFMRFEHTNASTGLDTTLAANIPRRSVVLSSAFDATPAGTIIGVSCNPGAAGVWTFQLVSVDAYALLN